MVYRMIINTSKANANLFGLFHFFAISTVECLSPPQVVFAINTLSGAGVNKLIPINNMAQMQNIHQALIKK